MILFTFIPCSVFFFYVAEADADFRIQDTRVTFEAGDVEKALEVDILDDMWTEPLKAFKVSLLPSPDVELFGYSETIISILDNDGK